MQRGKNIEELRGKYVDVFIDSLWYDTIWLHESRKAAWAGFLAQHTHSRISQSFGVRL